MSVFHLHINCARTPNRLRTLSSQTLNKSLSTQSLHTIFEMNNLYPLPQIILHKLLNIAVQNHNFSILARIVQLFFKHHFSMLVWFIQFMWLPILLSNSGWLTAKPKPTAMQNIDKILHYINIQGTKVQNKSFSSYRSVTDNNKLANGFT